MSKIRESAARHKLIAVLTVFVCAAVTVIHWPALSAKALFFDDDLYLTNNQLVQNPGPDSAKKFLVEVFEPSSVYGYYQPLTMISLMIDHALGGRTDKMFAFLEFFKSLILQALWIYFFCVFTRYLPFGLYFGCMDFTH